MNNAHAPSKCEIQNPKKFKVLSLSTKLGNLNYMDMYKTVYSDQKYGKT